MNTAATSKTRCHRSRACGMLLLLLCALPAFAGGPLVVGGPHYGSSGQPIIWNPAAMPIHYRVDSGPMATKANGTIVINNTNGVLRVQQMFNVWHSVSTANISFVNDGPIKPTATSGSDIRTAAEFDAVEASAAAGEQTPIIFDADGSILDDLGMDSLVIGFTSIEKVDETNGYILTGLVLMNGTMQDGVNDYRTNNYELTPEEFDQCFVHEFGHLIGLDHSQINIDAYMFDNCSTDNIAGLPVMFPISICSARTTLGLPALAPDDTAWISKLYPAASFATTYGTISGYVLFYDGISHAQGVNVIARRVDDTATPDDESKRIAVSAVSGLYFTSNPGQSVTGHNTGGDPTGSRDPLLIGYYEIPVLPGAYTVQVESVDNAFTYGSSVGPFAIPIPMPGPVEYWNHDESNRDDVNAKDTVTVSAGQTVKDITFILNTQYDRFDQYEGVSLLLAPEFWAARRRAEAGAL